MDTSFVTNLGAVLYRRFSNYKRNKKSLFSDVVVPALLLILGISLSKIREDIHSPSRI